MKIDALDPIQREILSALCDDVGHAPVITAAALDWREKNPTAPALPLDVQGVLKAAHGGPDVLPTWTPVTPSTLPPEGVYVIAWDDVSREVCFAIRPNMKKELQYVGWTDGAAQRKLTHWMTVHPPK